MILQNVLEFVRNITSKPFLRRVTSEKEAAVS